MGAIAVVQPQAASCYDGRMEDSSAYPDDAPEPQGPACADFARWARLPLEDIARDCAVQVFRASGPGGQCVNTTDSAVRMTHVPSGLTVVSRESRSQFRNRQLCLQKLRAQFERKAVPPKKRRPTKAPRRVRERRLADKRHRSQVKAQRRDVGD